MDLPSFSICCQDFWLEHGAHTTIHKYSDILPSGALFHQLNEFFICNRQLLTVKRELVVAENELRTLQGTYNDKQDIWIKEKLDFQVSDD